MFYKRNDSGYEEPVEGVKRKTLTYGDKTLMTEFRLSPGGNFPEHNHPHEQIGYLVSGKIALVIDGERRLVEPGDSWCIPSNANHFAEVLEESVAVEVFSPVREDYLP